MIKVTVSGLVGHMEFKGAGPTQSVPASFHPGPGRGLVEFCSKVQIESCAL